jgi:spermidine/putrescine transport system permease protein
MVKKILSHAYLYVILAVLYIPVALIVFFSFFNTSTFSLSGGFSFESYASIFTSSQTPELLSAIKNTLIIAAISSTAATFLGSVAAVGIFSMKRKPRSAVLAVNQLPMINSEIVMAVSLMIFFVSFGFPAGYLRLCLAHTAFCTPYVVLAVMPKLEAMDSNTYEAALDLGASPVRAMFLVLLPIMTPGIVSGFMLAFTLSLDDFIITQINKGATTGINTLSTYIYSDARLKGLSPFWFAIFSIVFVLVLAILMFLNLRNAKKEAKKSEELKKFK